MANVLLMDADRVLCRYVKSILVDAGHNVSLAFDGVDGIATFKCRHFDVVIVELFMPEKEGIETIRELKQLDREVPIIAVTAGTYSCCPFHYLRVAKKLGAQETLRKPFDPGELQSLVAACLN